MRYYSKAIWSNGATTDDKHDTKEQAEGVCRLLEREHCKANSPFCIKWIIKTWVEPEYIEPERERSGK